MQWAKNNLFNNDNRAWLIFASNSDRKYQFAAWRFVFFLKDNPKYINISLGSRDVVKNLAKKLESTSFEDFNLRGFITEEGIQNMTEMNDWLKPVAKTIHKSYTRGGKIYFHTDLISDFKALYDPKHPNFRGGTITELRYLADNGLIDKGVVEFRLGNSLLPADKVQEIKDAIKKYWIYLEENDISSFKGMFGINY